VGQSLVKNYLHITFSTKHRQPLTIDDIETELFRYIGGVTKELDCAAIQVGSYRDHIHVLCNLSKKIALMDYMELIKKRSSKWIKTKGPEYSDFYWQNGYGAFSVNPKEVDVVVQYIQRQREHHERKSFKDEFIEFLDQYDVPFDERYVWD